MLEHTRWARPVLSATDSQMVIDNGQAAVVNKPSDDLFFLWVQDVECPTIPMLAEVDSRNKLVTWLLPMGGGTAPGTVLEWASGGEKGWSWRCNAQPVVS